MTWSYFESPEAAVTEVEQFLVRAQQHDPDVIFELRVLFAPTGALQDTSMNSGWAERFLELAETFDNATKGATR